MDAIDRLEAKLKEAQQWPCHYTFKCIVPHMRANLFRAKFSEYSISTRPSKNGRYLAFTIEIEADSVQEVMILYRRASRIEGAVVL